VGGKDLEASLSRERGRGGGVTINKKE